MELNLESIIFYLLLLDALGANLLAWSGGQRWWQRHLSVVAKFFPLSRGWTTYYLLLVLLIGWLLFRLGALILPF